MLFRFSETVMGAAVAACTCSTVNSGLISVMSRPLSVTSSTHISVMILLTQWEAVRGRRHFSKILGLPLAVCSMQTMQCLAPTHRSIAPPMPGIFLPGMMALLAESEHFILG